MFPLRKRSCLNQIVPDFAALTRLSSDIGCNGFYPFTLEPVDPTVLVHGRMFAPAVGINEDPVTGNASGPVGAYLSRYNRLKSAEYVSFLARQGEAMMRSGLVRVHIRRRGDEIVEVSITGDAVIVFQSELFL
jgi:PhzF family phenazine biosynthesis protein